MTPSKPPRVIYLQVLGDADPDTFIPGQTVERADVTWSTERIYDSDVRYVIDKRQKGLKK